jgi:hypothetical protein
LGGGRVNKTSLVVLRLKSMLQVCSALCAKGVRSRLLRPPPAGAPSRKPASRSDAQGLAPEPVKKAKNKIEWLR